MMFVKKQKAQIILLDVIFFMILVLLIISIEIKVISVYKENIDFQEKNIEILKEEYFIELYLLDCNFLGYFNENTQKCYLNKIEVKNLDKIDKNLFCKITIGDVEILNKNEKIKNTYKRGVLHNKEFKVLEVSFCEK